MRPPRAPTRRRRAGFLRIGVLVSLLVPGVATAAPPDVILCGFTWDGRGNPVEGATVVVAVGEWRAGLEIPGTVPTVRVVTSGRNGRFVAEVATGAGPGGRRPGQVNVIAYKEGRAPDAYLLNLSEGVEQRETILNLEAAEAYVGVVQDEAGDPIAGATVRIGGMIPPLLHQLPRLVAEGAARGTPLERLFVAETDRAGIFRFPAVPAPGSLSLAARAEGKVPVSFNGAYVRSTAANPRSFTLLDEARVEGRVVTDLPGVAVAGLKVRVVANMVALRKAPRQDHNDQTVTTDADGRFRVAGLNDMDVDVLPQVPANAPWTARPVRGLALQRGQTATVTIELVEGAVVEGAVVDATSRAPLQGLVVQAVDPDTPDGDAWGMFSARTGGEGRYHFRLPEGPWRLVYLRRNDPHAQAVDVRGPGPIAVPPIEVPEADRPKPR